MARPDTLRFRNTFQSTYRNRRISTPGSFKVSASLPRRLSSLHFGTKDLDFDALRSFYCCEDISKKRGFAFYDECLKRSKSIVIEGQSFRLPSKLKKKLLYDEIKLLDPDKVLYRPSPVYRLALAVARDRDPQSVVRKLCEDASLSVEDRRMCIDAVLSAQANDYASREASASDYHLKNLQTDSM